MDKSCWAYVKEEYGLSLCHMANHSTDNIDHTEDLLRMGDFSRECINSTTFQGCKEYHFPDWLSGTVLALWILWGLQVVICLLWSRILLYF